MVALQRRSTGTLLPKQPSKLIRPTPQTEWFTDVRVRVGGEHPLLATARGVLGPERTGLGGALRHEEQQRLPVQCSAARAPAPHMNE